MTDSSTHQTVSSLLETHLASGQQVRFWVTSNSMHPCLQVGDAVVVERIDFPEIKIGDLLVIQREHDCLTHRVIQKSKNRLLTKGDNNLIPDPKSPQKSILGRVKKIRRRDKIIFVNTRKWNFINLIAAQLSYLEWKAFSLHRVLRWPFRMTTKMLQIVFR